MSEQLEEIFYYLKNCEVIVKYIDVDTKEELTREIIRGHEGYKVHIDVKDIEGYTVYDIPDDFIMSDDIQEVVVKYKKNTNNTNNINNNTVNNTNTINNNTINNNNTNNSNSNIQNRNTINNNTQTIINNSTVIINNYTTVVNNQTTVIESNTKPVVVVDNSNTSTSKVVVDKETGTQKTELVESKNETTPYTGDKVPEYTIFAILITIIANLTQVTIDKILKKLRFFK